jgi:GH25 family lysozyme M1 (1,4-beta-N-acetylmuramidase)
VVLFLAHTCSNQATEGDYFKSPSFKRQWDGAEAAGILRGAYHFAIPSDTTAEEQVDFFLANGGRWESDGKTLPPMIDFEKPPNHPKCYGMTPAQMSKWIRDFSEAYRKKVNRAPLIYAGSDWWEECTGDNQNFKDTNHLVLSQWGSRISRVPGGWADPPKFWQDSDSYEHGGDSQVWFGTEAELKTFAKGTLQTKIDN